MLLTDCPLVADATRRKYQLTLQNVAPTGSDAITNIYTHDYHISGDGNADDISCSPTAPGECLKYISDISSDHMGGTYWYHAHKHGNTNEHVAGGAFGMLIIEDQPTLVQTPDVAQWLANEEVLLIARPMSLCPFSQMNGFDFGSPQLTRARPSSVNLWSLWDAKFVPWPMKESGE